MKQNYIIPDWLNREFIEKLIMRVCKTPFQICTFSVESATQKGDNYASEMFRIKVQYLISGAEEDPVSVNFILKKNHADQKIDQLFTPFDLYRKEINCYRKYIPEFNKILKTINEDVKLCPELIYYCLDSQVFVMEDCSLENFRTADKAKRFSRDCARMILRKLALYHAASVIYNDRRGGQLTKVENNIFSSVGFADMFNKILDASIAEVGSWGEEWAKYLPDLQFARENFLVCSQAALNPSSPRMGVFIHGDMWLNNILVKFDQNKESLPEDILLIDFQLCGWGSRAVDLLYFCFTSLDEKDYQEDLDYFLKFYNEEFSKILRQFNYKDIPTWEDFKQEVDKKFFYAFFGGIIVKSIIYKENTDNADIDYLVNNNPDDLQNQNFKGERFRNEIQYLLKLFDRKGVWKQCRNVVDNRAK